MKLRTFFLYHSVAAFLLSGALLCAQPQASPASGQTNDALELVKQGQKLNSEGQQDEALALYDRALQLSPNLFQANLAAGMALDLEGKYEQARQHLGKAIEEAPPASKVQALRTMAVSYAFERKADAAAKYEQQAFDLQLSAKQFADAAGTADELARIYLESGETENAFHWYQTGHLTAWRQPNLTPAEQDLWDFRWESALARIRVRQLGRREEAKKHLAAAKAILDKGDNPDQVRFYPYLSGYVAFYLADYKTAIAELQKGDQKDPFVLSLLAQAYEKSGDKTQALEYYRKVLTLNAHSPTNAFARPLAKEKVAALSK
ncbi:MAG: tetratricopeptide repeat protein [Candidatus Korobacteraceae bacterium]